MIQTVMIGIVIFSCLFLFVRMPRKWARFVGASTVRLAIGLLLLVLLNVFGNAYGIHLPINTFTILVSSLLGIFGVTSLVAIHLWIIP